MSSKWYKCRINCGRFKRMMMMIQSPFLLDQRLSHRFALDIHSLAVQFHIQLLGQQPYPMQHYAEWNCELWPTPIPILNWTSYCQEHCKITTMKPWCYFFCFVWLGSIVHNQMTRFRPFLNENVPSPTHLNASFCFTSSACMCGRL